MIMNLCGLGFLCCSAVEDWKTQQLDVARLGCFGIIAILLRLFYLKSNIYELFEAMIIGVLVLLIGKATREAIGYGDGVVIMIMGLFSGFRITIHTCMGAFFILSILSIGYFVKNGIAVEKRIPFVPCLLLGYIGGLLW
ncbi:MAG: prepilin peptidase [Lachnospiraceae bacterium]